MEYGNRPDSVTMAGQEREQDSCRAVTEEKDPYHGGER
jgi:hypothetical protein